MAEELICNDVFTLNSIHESSVEKALNLNIEGIKVGLSIQDLINFMHANSTDLINISKEIEVIKGTDDLNKKSYCCNQIQRRIRECTVRNYKDIVFLIRLVCVLDLQKIEMDSNVSLLRHVLAYLPVKDLPQTTINQMMNNMAGEVVSVSSVNGDRIHLLNILASAGGPWKLLTVIAAWRSLIAIYNLSMAMPYCMENLKALLSDYPLPNNILDIKLAIHAIFKIVYKTQVTPDDETYLFWIKSWLQNLRSKIEQHFQKKNEYISPKNISIILNLISRMTIKWPSAVPK